MQVSFLIILSHNEYLTMCYGMRKIVKKRLNTEGVSFFKKHKCHTKHAFDLYHQTTNFGCQCFLNIIKNNYSHLVL